MTNSIIRFVKKVFKGNRNADVNYTAAIIVAAGQNTRMGDSIEGSKQFIEVDGKPLIYYTLDAFERAESIDDVIIVTREEDILRMSDIVRAFEFEKVTTIVRGGDVRQISVLYGLNEISDDISFVAIHDGARPFITPEIINNVVDAAIDSGAAAVAVKVRDTIKKTDHESYITGTIDRDFLWAMQTPQVFEYQTFHKIIREMTEKKNYFTDDCQLYEGAGKRVKIVEGSYNNVKITVPEDITLAEVIAQSREY